jgi:hypothetical protein
VTAIIGATTSMGGSAPYRVSISASHAPVGLLVKIHPFSIGLISRTSFVEHWRDPARSTAVTASIGATTSMGGSAPAAVVSISASHAPTSREGLLVKIQNASTCPVLDQHLSNIGDHVRRASARPSDPPS